MVKSGSANVHTPTQLEQETDALTASEGGTVSQHRALGARSRYRLHTPDPDQEQLDSHTCLSSEVINPQT